MNHDLNDRIAQWEKMVRQAPDDMAWFSLGNAYRDAERYPEAEVALDKAIQLNPQMSRAYQLRGQILILMHRLDEAVELLAKGYQTAAARRDVMPQRAMASLLEKLGKPLPALPESLKAEQPAAPSGPQIIDRKTGLPGTRLPDPPMRGAMGKFIYENYSQETWQQWIRTGTKVINELRLDLSNPAHQQVYDQHMSEWLGISPQDLCDSASVPVSPA